MYLPIEKIYLKQKMIVDIFHTSILNIA